MSITVAMVATTLLDLKYGAHQFIRITNTGSASDNDTTGGAPHSRTVYDEVNHIPIPSRGSL